MGHETHPTTLAATQPRDMTIRIAVPLRDAVTALEGGISLVVAVAKLVAFEFYECAMQAKQEDSSFDARYDDAEQLIDRYMLVQGGDMDGGGLFLAGEIEMPLECMRDTKDAMGAFGSDVQLFSMRPEPMFHVQDLRSENVVLLADEAGLSLPQDWERRVSSLQRKHLPPPVVPDRPAPRRAWPVEYAQERCACGNYASGADGRCNACKRARAIEAAQALATQLSEAAKRARVSDRDSALMRV